MKVKIIGNIWLDSVMATGFIFLIIYALSSLLNTLEAIDPVGEALEDVEFTDLVYSNLREAPPAEENVVLVNIGRLPRAGVAEQIRIINKYNPKVIGVDSFFPYPKDPVTDSILAQALSEVDNLVMASKLLNLKEEENYFDSMKISADPFRANADFAFANLVTEEGVSQEDVKTCRTFTPQLNYKGDPQMAFAVRLANYYAPEKVEKFLERNKEVEYINFKGNSMGSESNFATTFYALDIEDVFNENFMPEVIENKIVIFGFMGDYFGDPYNVEDKYFTPLNVKYAGRGAPDMYGAVIHANIISMILDEDYVYQLEEKYQLLIAVILCYINVVAFMWVYYSLPKWYDGITKITQLIELLLIIGFVIYAYHWFDWNLELTLAMGVVAAVGDSLEVYNGVVKNMFTSEGRKELFSVKRKTKKVVIN
ncbi:CHASE2 domain-containing protein [Marivirga sp. S37H4]|uniref:CHASE2 domain-containing protein n=1 Tax=Marivirga aurantiaca TaxID=2802615 RepID=A0A934WVA9_9BACT|nr:CHASE2 domain-containing protein [Marivirga aurantiaca]MBK6263601.1 CHASE2 domain-containing protein [Marivirga aurantiaca]